MIALSEGSIESAADYLERAARIADGHQGFFDYEYQISLGELHISTIDLPEFSTLDGMLIGFRGTGARKINLRFIIENGEHRDSQVVNDTYGHKTGDEILVEVSRRFSRSIRAADAVERLAGDDFLILLTDDCRSDQGMQIVRQIVECVSECIVFAHAVLREFRWIMVSGAA